MATTRITIKQQIERTVVRQRTVEFVSLTTIRDEQKDVACYKSDPLKQYIRKVERLAKVLNCTEEEAEAIILERV